MISFDIWEKWGRHIWEKGGCWDVFLVFCCASLLSISARLSSASFFSAASAARTEAGTASMMGDGVALRRLSMVS